jgi:hypothetical protein
MVDDDRRKFEIPWVILLPVIAAVAGIIAQYKPLVSERPTAPGEKAVEAVAEQDVDARLWQDPLAVAQKKKAELDAEKLKTIVPPDRTELHKIDALKKKVRSSLDACPPDGRILLLAVMLNSGPYIEHGESRLRARQAVLEGLSESGFVPKDSEHIGFINWTQDTREDKETLIPWEECKVADPGRVYPRDTQDAFVLWLPSASFATLPLTSFAALIGELVEKKIHDHVDIRLIGPVDSGGLQAMITEVRGWPSITFDATGDIVWQPEADAVRNDALHGVWIISPRATIDYELLYRPRPLLSKVGWPVRSEQQVPLKESVEKEIENSGPTGLRFIRTIATDDLVLGKLIDELKLRGIKVAHEDKKKGDKVVLLTEWDRLYSRSLAKTFAKLASNQSYSLIEEPRNWPNWILSYKYLRGIDGRLPGEWAKAAEGEDKQKGQEGVQPKPEEATEGLDQSDFLRRLARHLKDEDARWRRTGEGGIRAIGLLGSDIYDKLMILRALRPVFRDAVFFTNNFDAHFERRDDWSHVRNLVVASPFGGKLPRIELSDGTSFEQSVPPFRDNTQTSMFFGTLVATGRLDRDTVVAELSRQPRIFEIGRHGSVELYQKRFADLENSSGAKNTHWFREWLRSDGVWWHLILAHVALLLIIFWIGLSSVDPTLRGGGGSKERLKRTCFSTPFWLICGVPIIVLSIAYFSESDGARQEPLAFFSGISVWPSEMLRLIALLLAIHFLIKARVDLVANERQVTHRFFPKSPPSEKWRWRNPRGSTSTSDWLNQFGGTSALPAKGLSLRLGFRRWLKEHPDWGGPDTRFPAKDAWSAYLLYDQFWPRFIRIGALVVIYLCFSLAVVTLFPPPVVPARGSTAFKADYWYILWPTIIAMMILTFYVVDAIRLNSNFIRIFTYGVAKWEPDISLGRERMPLLTEEELSRYRDIFFVAQRTEAVAPLIWYPLIVLTLMFVARCSFFDHWTWPLSLILVFTLNAMWAIGSAAFLRRAAEQLRETAISNLQLLRVSSLLKPEPEKRRQSFDELIAEIRSLKKGAFAPLTEQPFIRAIIYPSGGLGLLAVAQRLLGIS